MSSLKTLLRLTRISETKFVSPAAAPPPGGSGVFGGTLVAQSLWAAIQTAGQAFEPSSLHCYFIVRGDTSVRITYNVEVLRQGTNFVHRQVRAYQLDKLIFVASVLLHKTSAFEGPEDDRSRARDVRHVTKADGLYPLEDTVPADDLFRSQVLENIDRYSRLDRAWSDPQFTHPFLERFTSGPVEYRFPRDVFNSGAYHEGPAEDHLDHLDYYQRVREPLEGSEAPEGSLSSSELSDPRFNYVAFAYLSDAYLLLMLPYFHQLPLYCSRFSVSLDHTIHFHQRPPVYDWMALRVTNPRSRRGKHLVNGDYFNAASKSLIASVRQEGLVVYDSPSDIRARF